MDNLQLVERINSECKKKKLKKAEMLSYCGVNHGYLSDLVKKNSTPSMETIIKFADYLNCSVDYLLGREQKSTPIEIENRSELSKELGSLTETEVDEFITIAKYVKSQRQKK